MPDAGHGLQDVICWVEQKLAQAGGGPHTHEQSEVVGLVDALAAKAASSHDHNAAYDAIGAADTALASALAADFSGDYADLENKPSLGDAAEKDVGTAAGTVAAGDHTHAGGGSALDAWPVGSVYIAVDSTSPATRFGGGTWAAFAAGKVLIGLDAEDAAFDAAEETGGAKTVAAAGAVSQPTFTGNAITDVINHTHPVSIDDPQHSHVENLNSATSGGLRGATPDTSTNTSTATGYSTAPASTGITATTSNPAGGVASITPSGTVSQPSFTGSETSVVQPYIVVYMWKRTA